MSIFPPEMSEKMNQGTGEFIKASEFENGLTLQIVKVEAVASRFGAEEGDYFVETGVLKEGETLRYFFNAPDGKERKLDSNSRPLSIAFEQAEIENNDWVYIKRTGKGENTRYTVTKVEAPDVSLRNENELDSSSVGF